MKKTIKSYCNPIAAKFPARSLGLSVAALSLLGSHSAMAVTDTMFAADPGGTSSFNTAGKWNLAAAPSVGNTYATSFEMRGIAPGTFAGDSLTLNSGGGALHGKMGGTLTFNGAGLILNGGLIYQANSFGSGSVFGIAGTITANASTTSFLGSTGGGESLAISGTIGGSGNITIAGSGNSGNNASYVTFDAANTLSGTVDVVTPTNSGGNISDATKRLLQLNNVNALQNATLALTGGLGLTNLVSFASASNTGAYNIGALSGATNQALTDTASAAVAISVGSKNANTTYSGNLSGAGSLTKVGTGTLTLSSTNGYTGTTTVSGGKLLVNGSTASGSAVSVSAGTVTGTPVATLGGTGTVGGNVSLAAQSSSGFKNGGILAPTASASGTALAVTGTTTFNTGSIFEFDLNAATTNTRVGETYGQLAGTGTISGSGAIFNIVLGTNAFTDVFWDTTKTWTNVFSGAGATNALTSIFSGGFGGPGVDSAGLVSGQGSFTLSGTNTLTWTAVPEPTSALAGLLIGAGLLRRRRSA
ncbi:MAG: autotransporter-associated beta strand repeat-containing protein [Luteolibacter sp.]